METLLALVDRLWQFGTSFWRSHRFGARVEITLGWEHSIVINLDGPDKQWRAITVVVTAPKAEEFVIASVLVQAKNAQGRWIDVWELDYGPVVVEANRQWYGWVSGESLVEKVKAALGPVSACQLRLTLQDHYGSKVKSKPLEVSVSELLREQWS